MTTILLVVLLGIAGVLARFILGAAASRYEWHADWPYVTFAINLFGSFLIGFVHVLGTERAALSTIWRIGLTVGLLGGFTTFSAFTLETLSLLQRDRPIAAFAYASGSAAFGVLLAYAGVSLGRRLVL